MAVGTQIESHSAWHSKSELPATNPDRVLNGNLFRDSASRWVSVSGSDSNSTLLKHSVVASSVSDSDPYCSSEFRFELVPFDDAHKHFRRRKGFKGFLSIDKHAITAGKFFAHKVYLFLPSNVCDILHL